MQPAVIGGNAKPVFVNLGIEHPFGFAGRSIDGRDLRQRRRRVEHPADHQRCRFVGAGRADFRIGLLDRHVGRFPPPGDAEVLGVIAIDLRQRRIARRGVGAGVSRPFALRQGLGGFRQRAGDGLGVECDGYCAQSERKAGHCDEPSRSCFAQCRLPGFREGSIRSWPPSMNFAITRGDHRATAGTNVP